MTQTIDLDVLNEAAKAFYEVAYDAGARAGIANAEKGHVDHVVRANVDMAIRLLESSVGARGEFDSTWPEQILAVHARSLLCRTPALNGVMAAIGALGGNRVSRHLDISHEGIDHALAGLKTYLADLGGYL